jgi:hypothetical protein
MSLTCHDTGEIERELGFLCTTGQGSSGAETRSLHVDESLCDQLLQATEVRVPDTETIELVDRLH